MGGNDRAKRDWVWHDCPGCGCEYRTRGKDAEAAPCPGCGRLPSAELSRYRFQGHAIVAAAATAGLGLVVVLGGLAGAGRVTVTLPAMLFGLIAAGGHALVLILGPDRNPKANKKRAADLADRKKLEVVTAGDRRRAERPTVSTADRLALFAHFPGVLILVASAMFAVLTYTPQNMYYDDEPPDDRSVRAAGWLVLYAATVLVLLPSLWLLWNARRIAADVAYDDDEDRPTRRDR